jgi:UTP--glucose-1-phosphate uridylyltransferase
MSRVHLAARLREELSSLPADIRSRLDRGGFDPEILVSLATRESFQNRVTGEVKPPKDEEIPEPDPRHAELGREAIAKKDLAFCVMAGGMATRMGGVVKALVEAIPGQTFLDLRLRENTVWGVPLWLMTSEATDAAIRAALPRHVGTFMQNLSVRLTPEGHVFKEDDGQPSLYATGHGDLPDALRRSKLLDSFAGKYVWITNVDNLGATIDETILGHFIASGKDVMVEVCEKAQGDRGGVPVHAQGKLQVLEEFRLPEGFDPAQVRVFNTNTFLVRANALATAPINWSWFRVEKKVDGRPAVQFERLLQELTAALPSAYVKVPREGTRSRFLPVKDHEELARRRSDIEAVARARRML